MNQPFFSQDLFLKLVMTPLIILVATLVARRWGERIGGLLIGLPLTSGPVSVFFALEQGQAFAAKAARNSMLGLIPVAVFCAGYVRTARRFPWYLAALISIGLYLLSVVSVSFLAPNLALIAILVCSALGLAMLLLGKPKTPAGTVVSPWWDLPLRMIIATAILVLITTGAQALGPKWSGLLSPFPIFTFVMVTFAHSQAGEGAAWRLIRGVLTGLFSYLAFFVVVSLAIDQVHLVIVYLLATLAALGVNGLSLAGLMWKSRAARSATKTG